MGAAHCQGCSWCMSMKKPHMLNWRLFTASRARSGHCTASQTWPAPPVAHHTCPVLHLTLGLCPLYCPQCGIPEAGGLALFRALARGNSTLRVLSLNNNSIGNKSASALGELLSVNFALQVGLVI
jgi:hypothetical protein